MALITDLRRTTEVVLKNPRQAVPVAQRALGLARARWVLRSCELGTRVSVQGPLELHNAGRVIIGDHAYFLPGMLTTRIDVHPGAELDIGTHAGFNFGVRIEVHRRVTIGARAIFASLVTISDAGGGPIVIGPDVWVAHGATISAGVTIGQGSVVSAGTTVMRDVPPHHLAIGVPARNVKLDTLSRAR